MTRAVVAELAQRIRANHDNRHAYVVGITGQDASGKTTLAAELVDALRIDASLDVVAIHVDDFHRPRAERYDPELTEADAYLYRSFDFEQLVREILAPLRREGRVDTHLDHLDLTTDSYTNRQHYRIGPSTIVVLEGVMLLRPDISDFLNLTVFVHADRETILDRAFTRNVPLEGEGVMHKYDVKYLPAQQHHLHDHPPQQHADVIIDNSVPNAPTLIQVIEQADALFVSLRPSALIFDFWETLVPFPRTTKRRAFFATAAALGEDPRLLRPVWAATRRSRETGPLDDYLRRLSREMDRDWSESAIQHAMSVRRQIHGSAIKAAAANVASLLQRLADGGARLALISNCSSDIRAMLDEHELARYFDAIVLSAEVGCMKPEPRIYTAAITGLGLSSATDAVYIGDGSDSELIGAERAGLHSIRLNRQDATSWPGTTATTLEEIVTAFEKSRRQ